MKEEGSPDGFTGCVVAPAAYVARARLAFRSLPGPVLNHAKLPRWLAADVRHYWSVALREPSADAEAPRKRDVDAVLSGFDRLDKAIRRLPHRSLGSVEDERVAEDLSVPTLGLRAVSAGHGSRQKRLVEMLARMRKEVAVRLGGDRRPGPRRDPWRRELETMVACDLVDAGLAMTKARNGLLARTLVVVYHAAGIKAPLQDSLFRVISRLVDDHARLVAWAQHFDPSR